MSSDFTKVARLSDLESGSMMRVHLDRVPVALARVGDTIYAFADTCTHDEASLCEGGLEGEEAVCPLHGARFNIRTGEETAPAFEPLAIFEVKVEGGDILIRPRA